MSPPQDEAQPRHSPLPSPPLPNPAFVRGVFARSGFFLDLLILLGLTLSTLAVYAQVSAFDFISYDDDYYVVQNPLARAGLTAVSIPRAFTAVVASNWIPVTMLSHMLDVELFGLSAGMHHLMNLPFHAAAAILLFLWLRRSTGARWSSAFVAFIFALHPLHVESVAWISERKDVLSAFFFFLALYTWTCYTERPTRARYLLVAAAFSVGLMCKPMLVTFPLLLIMLDWWPLRRIQADLSSKTLPWKNLPWKKLLAEKIPLLALSAAVSLVTFLVQHADGAVASEQSLSPLVRAAKALISCVTYIRQTFWPAGLAIFYPYPHHIPLAQAAAALAILIGMSALLISVRRTRPYLAVGWFWYLIMLVPVIGLVQVGEQSHADRYMYLPMVGLTIMVAWGAADLATRWPRLRLVAAAAGVVVCALCAGLTFRQAAFWQGAQPVFEHAIEVTGDNWLAEANLGAFLMSQNTSECPVAAIRHLEAALRIRPGYALAGNNLGVCFLRSNLCPAAIPYFEEALRANPNRASFSQANIGFNLGLCLMKTERFAEAASRFEATLRVWPDYGVRSRLAEALSNVPGRKQEAIAQYQVLLRQRPGDAEARRNLDALLKAH